MHPTFRRTFHVLPALTLAALMTACSTPPPGGPTPKPVLASPAAPAQSPAEATRQLQAHHWNLVAVFDGRGQPTTGDWRLPNRPALRLDFHDGRLALLNLCNTLGAGYTLDGATLKVERPIATMMACNVPGLMALEQRAGAQLPQVQRYALGLTEASAKPALTLHFADGSRWQFVGQPTPATRYGSAGERAFFEVAPQKVACNHPLMRNAMCLRVRELRYDDNGRKTVAGDWRILQGEIDGYKHQAGIRNVLRVQRYSLARNGQLPADAASHALVLDMVVESEQVR